MKILLLLIHSESALYNSMLEIQRSYIHLHPNFQTFFIQFRENQTENVEINGDFIYIKGKEDRIKITEKTIKCLDYLFNHLGNQYDFVIRSNISTIINLKNLYQHLSLIPKSHIYTGGNILNLNWIDIPSGIINKEFFNTIYAAGTSIIFSFDVIFDIVQNQNKLRYDIIDDVTFGIYINKFNPELISNINKYKSTFIDLNPKSIIKVKNSDLNNIVFIRNKLFLIDNKRQIDINNMKNIVKTLKL